MRLSLNIRNKFDLGSVLVDLSAFLKSKLINSNTFER